MAHTFDKRIIPVIQLTCAFDCLGLRGQDVASALGVGTAHCVVALRATFDENFVFRHIKLLERVLKKFQRGPPDT
ncbi:hypothetical protein AQ794_00390 [Burkholderia pseudomallei]|nr:hypothetical protein AQ753_19090 [Burkholderia pseudomallei]OMT21338.1 hypothetical protein AQ754_08630 [Burkholderia pseudomallei]OMT34009.1 hypothetical protein AQ755_01740 [Burkholderia pseudomallei]OMV37987.1 hypothetical protein AQ791_08285 [Burkholderia pseudomallei]OMV42194.1 hypothetical protein AQ792_04045 [Burkholderia pseudomallei]